MQWIISFKNANNCDILKEVSYFINKFANFQCKYDKNSVILFSNVRNIVNQLEVYTYIYRLAFIKG